MDKTEIYFKMSNCPEIQGQHKKWQDGDYYMVQKGGAAGMVFVWTPGEDEPPEMYEPIWLPRQDEIQEMMAKDYKNTLEMLCDFYAVVTVDQLIGFQQMFDASMEQHWLVFYMYNKHKKIWKNERWIDG